MWKLADIARAYSRRELLEEHGVGELTADEIEQWLALHGLALRQEDTTQA
ncbi:hypothetical protein [Bradyrhizobium brasilense]|nr:hypothetical protein [Bradyrhizobium brasilense]